MRTTKSREKKQMNKTSYLQGDSRWGGLVYPKKPCYIRNVGCGEVSIANILIEMEQYINYTPATIQPYCKQYGAPNCDGTYLSGICKMMRHYGLTDVKECDTMPQLWREMQKGSRVAVLLMGSRPGGSKKIHWTNGGHFIAATAYKLENGKHYLYIKDPWTASKQRNGWLSYEESLKGDVVGVYVGKLVQKTPTPTPTDKLAVDGIGGTATVKATQRFFGTKQDGTLGDQIRKLNVYYPSITAVNYGNGKNGSPTVKNLQKWLGLTQDGVIGQGTTAAWQKKLRDLGYLAKEEKIDGIFGVKSMKAWQKFLNNNEKVVYPTETPTIGSLANEYAYPTNTSEAKYNGGSPKEEYVKGLDKAYPNRSSWGVAPRKGASCDVFVGTCVRNAGVDSKFPRGLADQIPYLAKSSNFKEVSVTTATAKDGDIIVYTKTKGGGHICIVYDGKIKEAGFESYYPKTTNYLKQRLSTDGKKMLKVYRAVEKTPTPTPDPTPQPPYKVIDVSDWQGQIDWAKVKADGVVGAIIRYADGTTLDKRFAENMKNAKEVGLHIGAYIFSRAKTKTQAEKEATRLFNACKPYGCDMPLYIDLEVASLSKYANTVAQAFIAKIKALGGKPGVYANLDWWNNYLKPTAKLSFAMWLAQYNDTMDYKPKSDVGMWQYSSSGKVDGIKGKVDMDECYIAYWEKR